MTRTTRLLLVAAVAAVSFAASAPAEAAYARPCTEGTGVEGAVGTTHFTLCVGD
jgi:hypothetical protein